MDMVVANLFKHKIRLEFELKTTIEYDSVHKIEWWYASPLLQDIEKVDASLFKPFVYYVLSKVLHEDQDIIIDEVSIKVKVFGLGGYISCTLAQYCFETPRDYPELFFTHSEVETCPFPEDLINQPFFVWVDVNCYFIPSTFIEVLDRREFNLGDESQDEDEVLPSPSIKTYRQDCCVVCLESKPNILYLDCKHIAICDSCDRLKTTHRKNCDVCRAEISKRIKI